ncbi:hypothetical protein QU38_00375, partial [Staphylococcus aureus]
GGKLAAGALGEADHRRPALHRGRDPGSRRDHPALELFGREAARPAVEQLHGLDAGIDLRLQIVDRAIDDAIDQRLHESGIRMGEPARLRLLAAPLSGDHIGGDGPGTACEAQEGHSGIEGGPYLPDGLIYG